MTTRPDLAALARELRHRGGQLLVLLPRRSQADGRLMLQAADALSEPAAEADGPHVLVHKQLLSQLIEERDALHAQLAASKEEGASWRRVAEGLQSQLESAAPLFEAAHEYETTPMDRRARDEQDAALKALLSWARSEAGQRWKKDRG